MVLLLPHEKYIHVVIIVKQDISDYYRKIGARM